MHVQANCWTYRVPSARSGPVSSPQKTFAAGKAATPNLEAESYSETIVFVVEKTPFGAHFDHLKGGVRDTRFLEPIYQ